MKRYMFFSLGVILVSFLLMYGCSNIDSDWYEDELTNNSYQPPQEVMDMIGVEEGMVVGEFGAGYGRFTLPLASRVGSEGKVYANDIDKTALEFLSKRCRDAGIVNVRTILGKPDDPLFPKGALDMAITTLTYHEIENPVEFLKNLIPSLKQNAVLAIVDYEPKKNTERSNVNRDWPGEFDEAGLQIIKKELLHERDVLFVLKVK